MRIYKLTYNSPHQGNHIEWFLKKSEAKAAFKKAVENTEEYFSDNIGHEPDQEILTLMSIEPIDFPATKKGILFFLRNDTPNMDNG
jgi:hypothetical protein